MINTIWSIIQHYGTIIMNFLGKIYNFIQTTPFFTLNVFNFILVVAFFIWLLFFKLDIIGLFEKKSKEIAQTISNAEKQKADAIEYLKTTKKSLGNVDKDVEKIVQDANILAKNIQSQSKTKLQTELSNINTRTEILEAAQVKKINNEVSQNIAKASVAIAEEYIKNSLDENAHKELIYNFINDLDNVRVE